jgi:hypothetical protein
MPIYAVITLTAKDRYCPKLLSSHLNQFGARTGFRAAPPPSVVVLLEGAPAEDFAILDCKGVEASGLEFDPLFLETVRHAVRG